jgi:hypothetical protein
MPPSGGIFCEKPGFLAFFGFGGLNDRSNLTIVVADLVPSGAVLRRWCNEQE